MFEHLKKFRKVIVTGPQRSGTTITCRMVAHDTGHRWVDESMFDNFSGDAFWSQVESPEPAAIHGPNFFHLMDAPEVADAEDIAVLFVWRDINSILRSMHRIGWINQPIERFDEWRTGHAHCPATKQKLWANHFSKRIRNAFTVHYRDLKAHPLYLPDSARKGFEIKQTDLATKVDPATAQRQAVQVG